MNTCHLISSIFNNSLLFHATCGFHLLSLHSVSLIFPSAVLLSEMITYHALESTPIKSYI